MATNDAQLALQYRDAGMARAADAKAPLLALARRGAVWIARNGDGTCTADQVGHWLGARGYAGGTSVLGNAAGSIFKRGEWEWTGCRVRSTKACGHGNEQKVWRLRS